SDLDGLDDYSEIYIYGTNPYLEDTDNDNIWDKQEIINGTNPNCAEGTDCSITGSQQSNTQAAMPSLEEIVPPTPSFNENINSEEIINAMDINTSANDNSSDLQSSDFQEIINQLQGEGLTAEEKAQGLETLKNLTPAQIREQLIASGFDPAVLEQIDDETTLKNLTPAQIREQLIASGFDPAVLEQIDDETLQNTFFDLIAAYSQSQ
ncbi:MAG: hypothetical protein NT116_02535, partial [Candidatus Parcubacteria bacterium]|nr:hypothetical protein [Candidatus Parcubacteria bacterium]